MMRRILHDNGEKGIRVRDRVFKILRIIGYLIGFSVLLYPTVSNFVNQRHATTVIANYDDEIEHISHNVKKDLLEKARIYNQSLIGVQHVNDPFGGMSNESEVYKSLLNVNGDGMMGYIRIPSIKVELPIYHGTSEPVLQVGVGHLENTSLPVGGSSTHAVLTGHRGLPSAKLFTELDMVKVGDVFYIKIFGETLAYEVDQILTVLPTEMQALNIEKGKDYVTLVTCTPYAVNTHRMLVRGHRIPYQEANQIQKDEHIGYQIPFEYIIVCGIVIGVCGIIFMIRRIKR